MEITIDKEQVTISAAGMEYLRLKTEIYRRLGDLCVVSKNFIRIPASALPMVEDLLSPDFKKDEHVSSRLEPFANHAAARSRAMDILENEEAETLPHSWTRILDPAQATAVAAMTLPGLLGLCLFDEQGSGKTVMALASFDILMENGLIDGMIVVCPKSMIGEWPGDLEKFLPGKYKTVKAEGDRNQKYEAALSDFQVLVTNYEGVDVMLTSLIGMSAVRRWLLVVDESYYLKNGNSVRSVNVSKLRAHCVSCLVLCGTPAPNSAHDLIHQFDLADLGFTFGGFSRSKDPAMDWDAISERISDKGLFIRRLKTEILEHVPEKNFHVMRVRLQGRQARMYDRARTELEMELRTLDDESFKRNLVSYFQRRSALLQICCCPSAVDPGFTDTPAKYAVLDELLKKLTDASRKVIIWSFYKKSLDELMSRYAAYRPVRVDGSVPSAKRRTAVESFQKDPATLLFVGNPAASGAGITLHASYDAIYLSYSNQAAHYLQSLDRIHRRGQESDHVNYYLIACEGTIEETELIRLRGKELQQHHLLRDTIAWPTSLDDALNELSPHG